MPRPNRQKSNRLLWLAGLALWALSAAYFLHRYPLTLPAPSEEEKPAEFLLRDNEAPVALVVDTAVIRRSWDHKALEYADFSYGWVNIMESGPGWFDVLEAGNVDSSTLVNRKLVALTASALQSHSGIVETVASYTRAGGVTVIDNADSAGLAEFDPTSEISSFTASSGLTATSFGRGTLLKTNVDFGRALSLTLQGSPDKDMVVRNRHVIPGANYLEANDLALDSSMLGANKDIPSATSACAKLFSAVSRHLPLPRWHTAPDTFSGVFLMTHDEEGIGDNGVWMNRYERSLGVHSTTFILPAETHTADGLQRLRELGGEIGLHWNRFDRIDKGAYDTLRIWKWGPLKQKRSLGDQLQWLEALAGTPMRYNRNHYFLWDESYARTFRILNAQGITMDLSYGPDLDQKGYLFGSTFPFHPLDENGAPFTIYETPVTWVENFAGADADWVEKTLRRNAENYHGVIAPLYHNNTYDWRPDYRTYENWRNVYRRAQAHHYAFFQVSQLESFLSARRESPLNFEINAGQLRVFGNATAGELAVLIPTTGVGKPQVEYPIDQVTVFGELHWRVDVPVGEFSIICDRLETNIKQR